MAEKFIKTLKKICNYMTTVSENVSFDVLDDIAKNYNNMYHKLLKQNLQVLNLILVLNTVLILMKKIPT